MRKIGYAILLLCANVYVLFAQTDADYERYLSLREQSAKIQDNHGFWTLALSGGGTFYQGESDGDSSIKELITPYGKLVVARWFNAVWGLRLQLDGGVQKNTIIKMREPDSTGEFYFADGYVEWVTNIMNWGATKRSNRPISVYLYGGGGMAWTPSRESKPSQISPALVVGGQLNVRMSDIWSVNLELDGTIVKDNFNSHKGGLKYEGYLGVTIGLVYRFSQK